MKRYLILISLFSLFPIFIYSQSSVNAEDIVEKINNGVEVNYENVTIRKIGNSFSSARVK